MFGPELVRAFDVAQVLELAIQQHDRAVPQLPEEIALRQLAPRTPRTPGWVVATAALAVASAVVAWRRRRRPSRLHAP